METVPRAIPNFIRNVLAKKPPIIYGNGDDVRDYVHVSDVVNATLLALAHKDSQVQVFNVGTGRGRTTCEIAERIIRLTNQDVKPVHKPARHVSSKIVCDIARARGTLGYEPTVTLDKGLNDEISFFMQNPRLWREQ
jgi:UDP-glucose 4-epimerase